MKKVLNYMVLFIVLGGGFWVVNRFFLSPGNLSSGNDILAEIKLNETEIKNLANIKLDTGVFRDLKFMSLREITQTDRPSVQPGNENIFRDDTEKPAVPAQ